MSRINNWRQEQKWERQNALEIARPIIAAEIRAYAASLNMPKGDEGWEMMFQLAFDACALVAERGWTPPRRRLQPLYLADVWGQP